MHFDISGRLLVVDEGTGRNGRVLRMDDEGNLLEHAGCLPSPTHLVGVAAEPTVYLSCNNPNNGELTCAPNESYHDG